MLEELRGSGSLCGGNGPTAFRVRSLLQIGVAGERMLEKRGGMGQSLANGRWIQVMGGRERMGGDRWAEQVTMARGERERKGCQIRNEEEE